MTSAERTEPRWEDRWPTMVALGLFGALPTLVHLLRGAQLLVDDWGFAAVARQDGLGGFVSGVDVRSRPFQAAYHGITFVLFGDHPVPHLLLLAALNAAVVVLLYRVVRTRVAPHAALLAAVAFAALPNHGATRFWIATAPILVALVLALGALLAGLREHPRPIVAVACAVACGLTYEGGFALAACGALLAVGRATPRARRVLAVGATAALLVAVAAWVYLTSPKATGSQPRLGHLDQVVPSTLGAAVVPDALAALSPLVLVAIALAAVFAVYAPTRRRDSALLLAGGAIAWVLGAAPFAVSGFPMATDGMLDRGNVFATVGTALLLAGVLENLWRAPSAAVAWSIAAACLAVVALGTASDLDAVRDAQADGRRVLELLAATPQPDGQAIVLAPLPSRGGYAMFGYDSLGPAVELTTGQRRALADSVTEDEFRARPGLHLRFDGTALRPVDVRTTSPDGPGDTATPGGS